MKERRRRQRLPRLQLEARMRVRKGLLSNDWMEVNVADYNQLGIGIITDHPMKTGDRLQLSLRLATEVGDITINKVAATIRHTETKDAETHYGLEFESVGQGDTQENLVRIEGILARYAAVAERIQE